MLAVTHFNTDDTYSITETTTGNISHYKIEQLALANMPILGIFRDANWGITQVHQIQAADLSKCFEPIINSIVSDDVRAFASMCVRIIPKYIFSVSASSTGKYHPVSDIGYGGLVRHTIAVCKMMKYFTDIEYSKQNLGQRSIDCMLVACMMHDFLKSGWDEDFEKNKFTRSDHPALAANAIRGMIGMLDGQALEFIAHCIESHMGEWNTNKYSPNVVLPKPTDVYQWLVHLADYTAAKPDILMRFNGKVYVDEADEVIKVGRSSDAKSSIKKDELDENTIEIIKRAMRANVDKQKAVKLGINRNENEIKEIWDTIVRTNVASEKQMKYVTLAVEMCKITEVKVVNKQEDV